MLSLSKYGLVFTAQERQPFDRLRVSGYGVGVTTDDLQTVAQQGVAALRTGDASAARAAFERVAAAGQATPALLLMLAQACVRGGDPAAAHAALDRLLAADVDNIAALIMKGELLTAAGDDRAAMAWLSRALNRAAMLPVLPPELAGPLAHATALRDTALARFHAHLNAQVAAGGVDPACAPPRFAEALAILAGTKQPYFQQPKSFFYPGLPHRAFYERAEFAWVAALEAAAPAMRAEAEAVLASDAGVVPYVEAGEENRPNKGHALFQDRSWSAFHLLRSGTPVTENAARCPATMAALGGLPIPHIAGRSPMALFSILRSGTHIPPHTGMLNTRLIVHIPLIVPEDCRLRVGNDTRAVRFGEALIFDDSIEHEAWNDSGEDRLILLFEIWRPELDAAERAALTAMYEAIGNYGEG